MTAGRMIRKSAKRFSEEIMLKNKPNRDDLIALARSGLLSFQ